MSFQAGTMARIDPRSDRGGWSYGKTWAEWRNCRSCRHDFIGDRTATECAPCAYGDHHEAATA
jgi:hypothetical protein